MYDKLYVFVDGSSIDNPGYSGCGVVGRDEEGNKVFQRSEFIGENRTCNEAELTAIKLGLLESKNRTDNVVMFSDCEFAIQGVTEVWNVTSPNLVPIISEIQDIIDVFNSVALNHINREYNKEADALAKASSRVKSKKDMSKFI